MCLQDQLTNPYDVQQLQYVNNISINSFESFSESAKAKPDGTKIYIYGTGTGTIQQFSLSTPWDLNTATLETSSPSLDPQDSFGTAIFFKPDGTKVYFATQNKTIHQYTLSTPWDISTLTYDNILFDYTISPLDSYSSNLFIDNEGSSVYMSNQNTIMRFEMTTPWDISTATYQEMFTTTARPDAIIEGISLNADENKLIVIEVLYEFDTFIDQYDLTTANSLSTANYVATYTVDTSVTQLSEDIYIDTVNGHEMIILGASRIHRFRFASV